MRQNIFISIVAFAAILTGCGGATEGLAKFASPKPVDFIITPGYEIEMNGRSAKVFGRTTCSQEEVPVLFILGSSSLDGSANCLIVHSNSKTVTARVFFDGKLTDEIWTVEHQKSRIELHRPGGFPVIPYDASSKSKNPLASQSP